MKRSRPGKNPIRSSPEKPKMTAESIGSWWAGVARDDDNMDLGTLVNLLDLPPKGPLRFKTTTDKSLEIEFKDYPNSLPLLIGQAVVRMQEINLKILDIKIELNVCKLAILAILAEIG